MKNINKLNHLKLFNVRKFDPTVEEFQEERNKKRELRNQNMQNLSSDIMTLISGLDNSENASWKLIKNKDGELLLSDKAATGLSFGAKAATAALNAIGDAAMGDKNFGAQSAAIDSAVHGASSALMSSGNPYAMAAGAALEVGNFATKATGQTIQGFDVDINSTGYGNLGHMESKSSRDFASLIGLGGLKDNSAKLAERNRQAQMAMKAANISDDIKFEQEARMNSVDNVIQANQQALAGGIDTSLLGS